MWEESTRAVTVLRMVVLMVLVATLTVVALHGEEWGPVAAASATDSGTALATLGSLPPHLS